VWSACTKPRLAAASKVHASSCKTSHSLPPRWCLQGGQGARLCCSLCSGYVCVFCSSGRLPVFPDQVHTLEIQQFLPVPTLGLCGGLADGTLLHGLHSSLRHLHPPENQRTPEAGTGIVVTGQAAAACLRQLTGRAPGKTYVARFSSEKARGGVSGPSPEPDIALAGNLEGLESLSTAPRVITKCPESPVRHCTTMLTAIRGHVQSVSSAGSSGWQRTPSVWAT